MPPELNAKDAVFVRHRQAGKWLCAADHTPTRSGVGGHYSKSGKSMLSGLNHLTLAVSNLAASVAFYQQMPGMRLHARWDSGAYFSCGELWLCLSLDAQRQKTLPEASDYTHYAFSVAAEQFAEVCAQLAENGVVVWKENRSEGESYYFLDPDGHKLELHVGSLGQRLAACRAQPYAGMVFYDA